MKTFNLKFISMALCAAIAAMSTACSDDDDDDKTDNGGLGNGSTLQGEITENVTLTSGNTYKLSGEYIVKAPAVLTIEAGVTIEAIDDDIVDFILVEQGAKINAVGTAQSPIVMTSELKETGAWGGLHICGRAHTNAEGGTGLSEIGNATYGGSDDNDNSGTLRYVRLEYTGYALDEEHESNGVSFYGVGRGTTVEYVQTYNGGDDGFEFFGGSVDVKYCVATNSGDDSFDWTEGWNGRGQFLVAVQTSDDCDCLFECDNNGRSFGATPVAHPVLANLTLVGNNSADNSRGIRLRAGTQVELRNAIVLGKARAITVETTETDNALADGTSVIEGCSIGTELVNHLDAEGKYTNDSFLAATGNAVESVNLTNTYIGTAEGGVQIAADSFFQATNYKGAVQAGNDWTSGWTR